MVNRSAFVPAKELRQGDVLSVADGRFAVVAEIGIEDAANGESFTTYNFEVAEDHTYFVGETGVWVHNQGNPCDQAFEIFKDAKRAGRSDGDALGDAYKEIDRIVEGISEGNDIEKAKHIRDFEKILSDLPVERGVKARKLLSDALDPNPFPIAAEAQAHHIFGVEFFDDPVGKKLRGWAIDLNGKDNGVWLPKNDFPGNTASLHNGRPLKAYGREVVEYLSKATSREDALERLDDLRQRLLNGNLIINNAK